jgi:hypothetical protein
MAKFSKATAGSAKKSRWAGIASKADQTPILSEGKYLLTFKGAKVKTEAGEWGVFTFEVVEASGANAQEVGSEGVMLQGLDDRFNIGLGKVKSFVMALIGCPNDDAYDEFDPEGEFLDAVVYDADNARTAEAKELIGSTIECAVRRGKAMVDKKTGEPTGDYYREFNWTVNETDEEAAE